MPTNIYVQNDVNSFPISTPPPSGGLDPDAYQIKAGACMAMQETNYLTFNRNEGVKDGHTYVFTSTFSVAGVGFSIVISLTGTFSSSDFWIQVNVNNGVASASTAQISAVGTYYLSQGDAVGAITGNLLSGSSLGYTLSVVRKLVGSYDDVYIAVGPAWQTFPGPNENLSLPPYSTQGAFTLLDIGGEGRITTNEGSVTGFTQAYNVNVRTQGISNGPHTGQPIPNLIPLESWDLVPLRFPLPAGALASYATFMGVPVRSNVCEEVYRVLDKARGVVMIWADHADREQFAATFLAAAPGMVLKPEDPIGSPFNQIDMNSSDYGAPLIFGFPGAIDTNNF